jgi:hypothetical protein
MQALRTAFPQTHSIPKSFTLGFHLLVKVHTSVPAELIGTWQDELGPWEYEQTSTGLSLSTFAASASRLMKRYTDNSAFRHSVYRQVCTPSVLRAHMSALLRFG